MGTHCTGSDTSLAIFMHFRLPSAACFVSDFLVHIHTQTHTHMYMHTHTCKAIFGNRLPRFCGFTCISQRPSTCPAATLPQGHDRSDMPIAASVVDFPSCLATRKGELEKR